MITQVIFDWAKQTPDRTAVIFNGHPLSYRWFAHAIATARGYFVRRDYIGPGYAVLAVYNLLDFWVLSLALRSLGLTTVAVGSVTERGPLGQPNVRTEVSKLGLPNVRCVITNTGETWAGLDDLCTELGLPRLSVSLAGEPALAPEAFEAPHPLGGHILLTSGTTGIHKMVLMSSTFDAVGLRRRVEAFHLNQDTRFNVFNMPAWTGGGYGWSASTWIAGGTVIIEQWRKLYEALLRPGITHAVATPSFLATILAAPAGAFPRNDMMQLAVGGGAMTQTQIDQTKARITPRLLNWLGSTEVGVIALTPLDTAEDRKWHRLVPGRGVEIVDESDRPVPTGEIGQVRVSTEGGPTSYLNDEAATRAFFRDGYFYPGDLAVMRSDGRMALQGRATDVINVQGDKISPAPIEDRLAELLGVSGVCLFSMQNDSGEEEIHVVFETPTPIGSERLTAVFNQELSGFHRASVHYVAALPRNQMGKVLRQAVRAQTVASQQPFAPMALP